jgi:hypothetical protein
MAVKSESLIPASWFYIDESEKTKLNWFAYELACNIFEHIDDSHKKNLRQWKAQRSDKQIAEFCAYLAKRSRYSIYDMLEGVVDLGEAGEKYIRDYCHANTRLQNAALVEACINAWVATLEICANCPTGCLDEADMRCEMFDRMERGGYYS